MTGPATTTHAEPTTPICDPGAREACSICGDEAHVGHVVAMRDARTATVRFENGTTRDVAVDLVPDVRLQDRLLIHLGFAIARMEGDPS